jgi:hypothetical protein
LAVALFSWPWALERVPVNRPVERLDSLQELAKYEEEILDAIAVTPHGHAALSL